MQHAAHRVPQPRAGDVLGISILICYSESTCALQTQGKGCPLSPCFMTHRREPREWKGESKPIPTSSGVYVPNCLSYSTPTAQSHTPPAMCGPTRIQFQPTLINHHHTSFKASVLPVFTSFLSATIMEDWYPQKKWQNTIASTKYFLT